MALADVRYFYLQSAEPGAGYVVVVTAGGSGANCRITKPPGATANPVRGPSLAIRFAALSAWKRLRLVAVVAPADSAATAAQVAAKLGA